MSSPREGTQNGPFTGALETSWLELVAVYAILAAAPFVWAWSRLRRTD